MTNEIKTKANLLEQYIKQILNSGIKSEREFKLIQNYRQLTISPTQKIVDSIIN